MTNRATLRFGLRLDDWRNIATFDLTGPPRLETRTVAGDPKWITGFNHHTDDGTNTLLTVVLNAESKLWRTRVVAVDTGGKEHPYTRANATPVGDTATWTCTFAGLTVDQIREFQVQVQPVHWVEFRNVPLQPSGPPATSPRPLDISTRFGSAQEVTFDELLDLDTGRAGSFPVNPPDESSGNPLAGIGDNIAWMQEQGFDLEAGPGRVGMLGLKIVYLSAADWESLTPADLRYRLRELGTMPVELRPPDPTLPVTVGFRTREGGEGLFQIVRFADGRSATSLRLKHAQVVQVESHPVSRRAIDASWEELGSPIDLSSPERAVASFGMSLLAAADPAVTVTTTTIGLPRLEPGTMAFAPTPAQASALRSRRIVSIATYRQHLACVTVTGPPR